MNSWLEILTTPSSCGQFSDEYVNLLIHWGHFSVGFIASSVSATALHIWRRNITAAFFAPALAMIAKEALFDLRNDCSLWNIADSARDVGVTLLGSLLLAACLLLLKRGAQE